VGSTSEEMGHDPRLTAGGLLDVLRRAHAAVPGIYDLPVIETWAGLRPATAGRVPLVRRHPELPLVWANGLYRHGVLLSPLVARAAVNALRGQALPPEVAQLQP
jgi:glycine oxidase